MDRFEIAENIWSTPREATIKQDSYRREYKSLVIGEEFIGGQLSRYITKPIETIYRNFPKKNIHGDIVEDVVVEPISETLYIQPREIQFQ